MDTGNELHVIINSEQFPARLTMWRVELALITYNGRPVALNYGGLNSSSDTIAALFTARYGHAPYTTSEMYSAGYQASGGYTPKAGSVWKLQDGRLLRVTAVDGEAVSGMCLNGDGCPLTIALSDLNRATAVEVK
jgi:hypothetical protein